MMSKYSEPMILDNNLYKKYVRDSLQKASLVATRREEIRSLKEKKTETYEKIYDYFVSKWNPEALGMKEECKEKGLLFNINFRIGVPESEPHRNSFYTSSSYKPNNRELGFFFDSGYYINTRVKDYNDTYRAVDTGHKDIVLLIDYAEEILLKAKRRMRLSKYKGKYDLQYLVSGLELLVNLRGDKYLVREGTPPKKFVVSEMRDPTTGRTRKRGDIVIPFDIVIKSE